MPVMLGRNRRPPFTLVLVAVLLILLPALAYLQYGWQGSVSERLREQMQETMKRAATQFVDDFDREIARVSAAFQPGRISTGSTGEERNRQLRQDFAALYTQWNQSAMVPKLVRDVYLSFRVNDTEQRIERLNLSSGEFESIPWPADLKPLESLNTIQKFSIDPAEPFLPVPLATSSIDRTIPAVIIPIAGTAPVSSGRIFNLPIPAGPSVRAIVKLNLEFIQKEFIPALARQYVSGSDETLAYNIAVVQRGPSGRVIYSSEGSVAAEGKGDISVEMFAPDRLDIRRVVTPDFNVFTATRDIREKRGKATGILSFRIQRDSSSGPVTLLEKGDGAGAWDLVLTHQAGSLDKAVAQARSRNLAISFGILLLLAVSVALILVSAQRERRLAQQQLEFVSAVSHELRTPLAVICSAGENLADGVVRDAGQTRQYGTLVRNEGRRLTEMVEQILDFAGIHSGQKPYRLEPTDVAEIVDRALETFEMQIRDTGVALEKQIAPGLPLIMADRAAMVRAVQNLIGNALKYGDSGKSLVVRAEAGAGPVTLTVADRGEGIAQEDLPHIFEPFFRSAKVIDAQIKGSGLGLALVKQIVEAHGARITVETSPAGTAFQIVWPRAVTVSGLQPSHDEAYSSR